MGAAWEFRVYAGVFVDFEKACRPTRPMVKYLISLSLVVFACSKDIQHPDVKISFDKANRYWEVDESGKTLNASGTGPAIILSRPVGDDLYVTIGAYSGKYDVDYSYDKPVRIRAGSTFASVGFKPVDDEEIESDEFVSMRIQSTDNPAVRIDTAGVAVTIYDNDKSGLTLSLFCLDTRTGFGAYDMDVYLWYESPQGSGHYQLVSKANGHNSVVSSTPKISLKTSAPDGRYALSYVYYSGTSDALEVQAYFLSPGATIDGKLGVPRTFKALYRQANINTGIIGLKEQFFTKTGSNFTDFTPITVPANGS